MMMIAKTCPECNGFLYDRISGRSTSWWCFKCGYYESDSSAYRENPKLISSLMREYFPKTLRKSLNQPTGNTNKNHLEGNST